MAGLRPVELFSLAVPADGEPVPGLVGDGISATFRITMAAIDPTAIQKASKQVNGTPSFVGSTLKIIRVPIEEDDEDEDDDEDMEMAQLLNGDSDIDDSDEDDEVNGGHSDPSKISKTKRIAALKEAIANGVQDDGMDVDGTNIGSALRQGKSKAAVNALNDESEDESEISIDGAEQFVICTLDPSKQYQQPLDITISEDETVFFQSTGTHTIYLTGNILIPESIARRQDMYGSDSDEDSEDGEYDLSPGEDELDEYEDEDESDVLDDMEDPRITELDSDEAAEEVVPKLVEVKKAASAKGKNKRSADDSSDIEAAAAKLVAQAVAAETEKPLTKSQLKKMRKKMKDNDGNAIETVITSKDGSDDQEMTVAAATAAETTPRSDKKVQFAKTLVQGPSGSTQANGDATKAKNEKKKSNEVPKTNGEAPPNKASKGTRTVKGVVIDDRKIGAGPAAKKGDKVSMRYIGKLESDKRVFDSNKKGPPFRFTLGNGQVIAGWDIGLTGIAVGGERRLTIPAHLAYGSSGTDGIPGNSTLIFDVKCLEIK